MISEVFIFVTSYSSLASTVRAGQLGALPPDVLDQIAAMQKAIDKLTADLASVCTCTNAHVHLPTHVPV